MEASATGLECNNGATWPKNQTHPPPSCRHHSPQLDSSFSALPLAITMALRLLDYKLAPALRVFPTLKRFTPAFQPRWLADVPPGGPFPEAITHGSIGSVYEDLGVIAFAGASVKQATHIGTLLEKIVSVGGPSMMRTANYSPSDRYSKVVKYRLPVEDGHIDSIFKTEVRTGNLHNFMVVGVTNMNSTTGGISLHRRATSSWEDGCL